MRPLTMLPLYTFYADTLSILYLCAGARFWGWWQSRQA